MAHTTVNYHDIDATSDAMHFLRAHLGCEQLGVTVVDCDPGWTDLEDDHGDEGYEEVDVLAEGEATMTVVDEAEPMTAGDVIRIPRFDSTDPERWYPQYVRPGWGAVT